MNNKTYKILLVGDSDVGKTAFIKRHVTGEFERDHVPTIGVSINPLKFNTNYGVIIFNVWDCTSIAPQYQYYKDADGAIVMFESSVDSIFKWIENLQGKRINKEFDYTESNNNLDNSTIVICRNKLDQKERKYIPSNLLSMIASNYKYWDISAKSNYNFEKPFLQLAKVLTGKKDLKFIQSITIPPPVVNL